jgi:predicted small metal-binding protein
MMPEFSCADAGADVCRWKVSGDDENQMLEQIAEHLKTKHNVQVVSQSLARYALAVAHKQV